MLEMTIEEIVSDFLDEKLAIDYSEATEEEILKLEEILDVRTLLRPHDDMSYSQHMLHYRPQGYSYLVADKECASSYKPMVSDCRDEILSVKQVLDCALRENDDSLEETDMFLFTSLFD